MKIINVINDAANLLGLEDVSSKLAVAEESQEESLLQDKEIKRLLDLIKFAIQELCSHYIPVVVSHGIKTNNCSYPLADLTNYIKLIKLYKQGVSVPYKIVNRIITVQEDGEYEVEYMAYPEIQSLFDSIDYVVDIGSDVVVCGLCAYYSLAKGMFDEFERFHEEYVEKAENIKALKVFDMPCRRWE